MKNNSAGQSGVRIFNRRQSLIIWVGILLLIPVAMVPPWRYMDGTSAGFHPIFSPPPSLPDSSAVGEPVPEYNPIMIIPQNQMDFTRRDEFSSTEMRHPYLDIRKMLGLGTILFLATGVCVYLFRDNDPDDSGEKEV